jgi:hypothetical protein
MNIIGLTGKAGSGKDEIAKILVAKHNFVTVSFADPMKRFCMEIFHFTVEQLWGPSEKRNEPDLRYPRKDHKWEHGINCNVGDRCLCCNVLLEESLETTCCLTPRYALQTLGTEWGRNAYTRVWSTYAFEVAKTLLAYEPVDDGGINEYPDYTPWIGIQYTMQPDYTPRGVVIPDFRFQEEIADARALGGRIWHRSGAGSLTGAQARHISETTKLEYDEEIPWVEQVTDLPAIVKDLLAK